MSTDDIREREFDLHDSEGLPVATLEHEENTSIHSESEATSNGSNQRKNTKPSGKPRREVWWLDLGTTNHNLMSVGRCFEDRLNWSLLSSSNSLLPHIRSTKDDNLRRNLHQCPGYLREEIALACDLSKSAIVSHAFPGPSERCSICHQLVQYDPYGMNLFYRSESHSSSPSSESTLPSTPNALEMTYCPRIVKPEPSPIRERASLQPLQEEHQKLSQSLESTVEEMRKLNLPVALRFLETSEKWFLHKLFGLRLKLAGPGKAKVGQRERGRFG